MKAFLHLVSPIATLIGLLVSSWGTYWLLRYYAPFKGLEFWKSVWTITKLGLTFRFRTMWAKLKVEALAAKKMEENRVYSLAGVYLLFWGFALQLFGAVCWLIDSKMDLATKN